MVLKIVSSSLIRQWAGADPSYQDVGREGCGGWGRHDRMQRQLQSAVGSDPSPVPTPEGTVFEGLNTQVPSGGAVVLGSTANQSPSLTGKSRLPLGLASVGEGELAWHKRSSRERHLTHTRPALPAALGLCFPGTSDGNAENG